MDLAEPARAQERARIGHGAIQGQHRSSPLPDLVIPCSVEKEDELMATSADASCANTTS